MSPSRTVLATLLTVLAGCATAPPDDSTFRPQVARIGVDEPTSALELGVVTGSIYMGDNSFETRGDDILNEMRSIGVRWIRVEVDPVMTADPSARGTLFMRFADLIRRAHTPPPGLPPIKVDVLVSYWYCGQDDDRTAIDHFTQDYIQNHLGPVSAALSPDAWEIINEPNSGNEDHCGGGQRVRVTGNAFAHVLRAVGDAQSSGTLHLNAPVISGGILHTGFITTADNHDAGSPAGDWGYAFLHSDAWSGLSALPFQYLGIHPYNSGDHHVTDANFDHWYEQARAQLTQLPQVFASATHLPAPELAVTEFGWQDGCSGDSCVANQEEMAHGMLAAVAAMYDSGVVRMALWYDWRDDAPGSGVQTFGLYDIHGTRKTAPFDTFCALATGSSDCFNNPTTAPAPGSSPAAPPVPGLDPSTGSCGQPHTIPGYSTPIAGNVCEATVHQCVGRVPLPHSDACGAICCNVNMTPGP